MAITMQLEFQRSILHHFIHQELCIAMNAVPKKRNNILVLKFTQQVHLILKFNHISILAQNNYHYGYILGQNLSDYLKFFLSILFLAMSSFNSCLDAVAELSFINTS